jgi:Replication-relaxation
MQSLITDRDVAVLVSVYKYRYLSVSQIEALHFPSLQTMHRRLRALTAGKYLKSFTVPGIAERVFYLDRNGAEVVAGEMLVDLDALKWHRAMQAPKDYRFLRHFLAINDFRITLTLACQNTAITLLDFIPEYIGEKTRGGYVKKYLCDTVCDVKSSTQQLSHTPDGAFALEKEDKAALFFVEIDRGDEVVSDLNKGVLKSMVFYLNYWLAGKHNRYEQDFEREFKTFRALLITNSPKRLQNIREAVTKYPFPKPQAKRFLWGATDVTKDNLFHSIWQSMDATDQTHYKIG